MPQLSSASSARFFQIGYVTLDLDSAIDELGGREAFYVIDVDQALGDPSLPVKRIALSYLGELNIELIEIRPEVRSIFDGLDLSNRRLKAHHLGYLIEDAGQWELLVAEAHAAHAVAMEGGFGDLLSYFYVESRAETGQFTEYVHLGDGGRALFAEVPRVRLSPAGTKG